MEVRFRTRRLERCHEHGAEAIRTWGPVVGPRYVLRVNAIRAAEDVSELYAIRAYDLHPLGGDRRGHHAMRLTGQLRLILTFETDRSVIIEEVVDYHA